MSRSVPEWIAKHSDQRIPPRVRLRVFERFHGICQITNRRIGPADKWDLDHAQALTNGGEHRESNLRPVLRDAHRRKTSEDVAEKAKMNRVRAKHIGARKRSSFATSRDGRWKQKINGEMVLRSEES